MGWELKDKKYIWIDRENDKINYISIFDSDDISTDQSKKEHPRQCFIEFENQRKNISEWSKILGITRQCGHQLYKKNLLLKRIQENHVAKK